MPKISVSKAAIAEELGKKVYTEFFDWFNAQPGAIRLLRNSYGDATIHDTAKSGVLDIFVGHRHRRSFIGRFWRYVSYPLIELQLWRTVYDEYKDTLYRIAVKYESSHPDGFPIEITML